MRYYNSMGNCLCPYSRLPKVSKASCIDPWRLSHAVCSCFCCSYVGPCDMNLLFGQLGRRGD